MRGLSLKREIIEINTIERFRMRGAGAHLSRSAVVCSKLGGLTDTQDVHPVHLPDDERREEEMRRNKQQVRKERNQYCCH